MLGLNLRKEFEGRRLQGTVVDLKQSTQRSASEFLEITYPSADLLRALTALRPEEGRTVVLRGSKGKGKSHLLAALHHSLTNRAATHQWLDSWSSRLARPELQQIPLRQGLEVVSYSLHHQKYDYLWEPIFKHHPRGDFYLGKWDQNSKRKAVPPKELLEEMLAEQPMALLFDEYQTWFDGLVEEPKRPHRTWAFNLIQVLSEIASERPEHLLLVVSVRDGNTEAYQQIHRLNPLIVDFSGPEARRDRQNLLLHRLFENRQQVDPQAIQRELEHHVATYLQLYEVPADEHDVKRTFFVQSWPFSPLLMELLEDQILVATDAQETRDLIKILAGLFKKRGADSPILTSADFDLLDDSFEVGALLESVSGVRYRNLKDRAVRNLQAVQNAVAGWKTNMPQLPEILSALWIRSLAVGNAAGAEPRALQLDITRGRTLDPNSFAATLDEIEQNSFNIHREGRRLVFREDENPQARLLAEARNERLFKDGSDEKELLDQIRYALAADDSPRSFVLVVLGKQWSTNPWANAPGPDTWGERIPLVVLPEAPKDLGRELGPWLKRHVPSNRNTVRFLYSNAHPTSVFHDPELQLWARACVKAAEYKKQNPAYSELHTKYKRDLQRVLKERYDRFAILERWNFQQPELSQFRFDRVTAQGGKIPESIDAAVLQDLFESELFEELALQAAQAQRPVAQLLQELRDPRPAGEPCIPWVGETILKEKLTRLCAAGKIRLNLRGTETLQRQPGEAQADADKRMKGRLGSGRHLEETLLLPAAPQGASQAAHVPIVSDTVVQPLAGTAVITDTPPPGPSLFDPAPVTTLRVCQAPANSSLNLLGKLETWGIQPGSRVPKVALRLGALTGSQLQLLLRELPTEFRYELELEVEGSA